jgi:DNA modification methylase
MKIERIKLAELRHDDQNARTHDQANLKAIAGSLEQFGQRKPIVITQDNKVVAGNGTLTAAKLIGWTEIDCVRVPADWTADQIKAYALADNRTAELAEWDKQILAAQLIELEVAGFDIEAIGFEVEKPIDTDPEEPELPDLPAETKTKLGDLWQLGNHRLLCGDSSDKATVQKLLDEPATLLLTDPPYRYKPMGSGGVFDSGYKKLKQDIAEIIDFDPKPFLEIIPTLFSSGINAYIFCNTDLVPDYLNWARENKYNFNILTWHKKSFIPASNNHHFPDTEYLLYISKSAKFNSGLPVNYGKYFVLDNEKSDDHPTIKPLEILINEIQISSDREDIVADLYAGSGSTLIACEKTDRRARVIELDPKYCDVIIQRWENLTGKKAELVNASR